MSLGHDWPRSLPATWRDEAACSGSDPAIFHPNPISVYGASRSRPKMELRMIANAKAICATCAAGDECEAEGKLYGDSLSIRNAKLPEERGAGPIPRRGYEACGTDAGYRAHYRSGHRGDDICLACRAAHREVRADWQRERRNAARVTA